MELIGVNNTSNWTIDYYAFAVHGHVPYFARTSYSHHLHIHHVKLTANCILRCLDAENTCL